MNGAPISPTACTAVSVNGESDHGTGSEAGVKSMYEVCEVFSPERVCGTARRIGMRGGGQLT